MTSSVRDRPRQAPFLNGLTDSALHHLSKLVTPATYAPEQLLFEEGSARDFMAVVMTGAVAIEKHQNGRPVRLATIGPGEAVGEGLLLDASAHGTSARSIVETEALVL